MNLLRELDAQVPLFRARFDALDAGLGPELHAQLGGTLRSFLYPQLPIGPDGAPEPAALQEAERRLTETQVCQPVMAALGLSLHALLEALSIEADALLGHSLGEFAAAAAAGMLPAEECVRLVARRGLAMVALPLANRGAMASVAANRAAVAEALLLLPDRHQADGAQPVVAANLNHPRQTVISGDTAGVAAARALLETRGLKSTALEVSHAFHSPRVAGVAPEMERLVAALPLRPARGQLVSGITGARYPAALERVREILGPPRHLAGRLHGRAADRRRSGARGRGGAHLPAGRRRERARQLRPQHARRGQSPGDHHPRLPRRRRPRPIRAGAGPALLRRRPAQSGPALRRTRAPLFAAALAARDPALLEPRAAGQLGGAAADRGGRGRQRPGDGSRAQPGILDAGHAEAARAAPQRSERMDSLVALFREQVALLQSQAQVLQRQAEALAAQGIALPEGAAPDAATLAAAGQMVAKGDDSKSTSFASPSISAPPAPAPAHAHAKSAAPSAVPAVAPAGARTSAAPAQPAQLDEGAIRAQATAAVLASVARISAFPVEALKVTQTLAGDPGFDSLMTVELDGDVQKAFPGAGALPRSLLGPGTSVQDVIDHLVRTQLAPAGQAAPAEALSATLGAVADAGPELLPFLPVAIDSPRRGELPQESPLPRALLLTRDAHGVALALAARLAGAGHEVVLADLEGEPRELTAIAPRLFAIGGARDALELLQTAARQVGPIGGVIHLRPLGAGASLRSLVESASAGALELTVALAPLREALELSRAQSRGGEAIRAGSSLSSRRWEASWAWARAIRRALCARRRCPASPSRWRASGATSWSSCSTSISPTAPTPSPTRSSPSCARETRRPRLASLRASGSSWSCAKQRRARRSRWARATWCW